ncbi:MAG TPA: glycosyl transferase [Cyanobacteria bacterium UBA11372]|nr:glycosyl transferase [Cyanobacteria bacterium UBA11372]
MPANSWPENDSYNEPDDLALPSFPGSAWEGNLGLESTSGDSQSQPPIGKMPEAQNALESDSIPNPRSQAGAKERGKIQNAYAGRRRKAAVVLTIVWSGTIALHLFSWATWIVLGLTTLMGIQVLRVVRARPRTVPAALSLDSQDAWPFVSLLVAAKNEEAVISKLVENFCNIDYPSCRYELWVIDDNSEDGTPILLDKLATEYDQLRVFHRAAGAGGGKSGALNQVIPLTKGDIIAVFDADAQMPPDLLRRVLPLFERQEVGAVQVRKAIANSSTNFLTRSQAAEMALDSFFQQQRIAIGGIGELRGNGQFIRRTALIGCDGFNEETITDDLDLTFRLHLDRWDIDFLLDPGVDEEGVTKPMALWHQRNRWAEGGYQRYLDYWRPIVRGRLGRRKTFDLLMFWFFQYVLPTAAVPDMLMAIARNQMPMLSPVTGMTVTLSLVSMFCGLRRIQVTQKERTTSLWVTLLQTLRGILYMLHWFAIVASVTARMSVRPKRLKWVKTMHSGHG